jgi:hypothetical protein
MTVPGWGQTPDISEALAKLEDAELALDRAILAAKQVEQQVPKTQLSEEDIRQIEEHARGADAPRELRELQRRIDAGELSWEDIASGRHQDDPTVQAALSPAVDGMHQAYTMIQEGQDLDEIIESPPAVRQTDARDDTDDDDDDPDDEGPVFRGVY